VLVIWLSLGLLAGVESGLANPQSGGDSTVKILPKPRTKGTISVEEAIAQRRSVRSYSSQRLTDEELSQLLWAAQGITDQKRALRAAPSAGATYPLEIYAVTPDGVFHYDPIKHSLETVKSGDVRAELATAAYGQSFIANASATIVFAAVPERTTRRYGRRGMMYIHMEAGHAAQNIHLQAVALRMGSVPVGAFDDEAVSRIAGLPDNQIPLYLIPVGR